MKTPNILGEYSTDESRLQMLRIVCEGFIKNGDVDKAISLYEEIRSLYEKGVIASKIEALREALDKADVMSQGDMTLACVWAQDIEQMISELEGK